MRGVLPAVALAPAHPHCSEEGVVAAEQGRSPPHTPQHRAGGFALQIHALLPSPPTGVRGTRPSPLFQTVQQNHTPEPVTRKHIFSLNNMTSSSSFIPLRYNIFSFHLAA